MSYNAGPDGGAVLPRAPAAPAARRTLLLILAPLLLASDCGPTNQEIGQAGLIALALVPLIELPILAGLMAWLRRVLPATRLPKARVLAISWGLLLLVHLGAAGVGYSDEQVVFKEDLALSAFLLLGSMHLAVTLLCWRILSAVHLRSAAAIAPWVGWTVTGLPAWLMFGAQISKEAGDRWVQIWLVGSLWAWLGPIILLLVIIELFTRSRQARAKRR